MNEPNISLTGDQARILMVALRQMTAAAPIGASLELYIKLAALSQVQPPQQSQDEQPF